MSDLDTKGLDNILKMLKSTAIIKVGILGEKSVRGNGTSSSHPSNADIGAQHEFGTSKVPKRSFLLEPITDNMDKYLKEADVLDPETLKTLVKTVSPEVLLRKIGILAEGIIGDGFSSGGFGKWAPWKSKGYENNTGMILVDSQQLRNSITSEVAEG